MRVILFEPRRLGFFCDCRGKVVSVHENLTLPDQAANFVAFSQPVQGGDNEVPNHGAAGNILKDPVSYLAECADRQCSLTCQNDAFDPFRKVVIPNPNNIPWGPSDLRGKSGGGFHNSFNEIVCSRLQVTIRNGPYLLKGTEYGVVCPSTLASTILSYCGGLDQALNVSDLQTLMAAFSGNSGEMSVHPRVFQNPA